MLKWFLVLLVVVLVVGLAEPALARRLGLGRLLGDVAFRLGGRSYHFPFATTLLLSALAWLFLRWL